MRIAGLYAKQQEFLRCNPAVHKVQTHWFRSSTSRLQRVPEREGGRLATSLTRLLHYFAGNSRAVFSQPCVVSGRPPGEVRASPCMDGDDDLQLNLAGFEAPVTNGNPRSKGNRHTIAFKKQQKVTSGVRESAQIPTAFISRYDLARGRVRRSKGKQSIKASALTAKAASIALLHPQLLPVP